MRSLPDRVCRMIDLCRAEQQSACYARHQVQLVRKGQSGCETFTRTCFISSHRRPAGGGSPLDCGTMSLGRRISRTFLRTQFNNGKNIGLPACARYNSTSTSQPVNKKGLHWLNSRALLLLGGISIGLAVASTLNGKETDDTPKNAQIFSTSPGLNDTYGSIEDFEKAIAALQAAFPVDSVSTDLEVLEYHGSSENDYHPGNQDLFSLNTRRINTGNFRFLRLFASCCCLSTINRGSGKDS